MFVNFNILNQLGSPAINSNTFANRPAAGQTGRLFVSTDTFEIYRDNGTTWDLIGGPGTSTITGTGTATQVAYFTSSQAIGSSANLYWDNTNTRLGIGTSTPGVRLDIHGTGNMLHINSTSATANALMSFQRTGTNVWRLGDQYNGGSNFFELHNTALANNAIQIETATNKSILTSIESYSTGLARGNYLDYTLSLPNGTTFTSPNTVTALGATLNLNIAGSATIPAGARSGADFFNGINFTSAGTFTVNQSSTIRAFSNVTAGWAFNGSAVGTVTHLAGLRVLFPTNSGSAINVTDNYALLINNQNANTGTITYTNRWGIYQEGASDLNYMAANLLLGSTVNTGDKLQVNGTTYLSSQLTVGNNTLYVDTVFNRVGINTNSPNSIFEVKSSGTGTKSIAAAFLDSSTNGNGLQIYNENGLSSIYATYYFTGSNQDLGFYTTTSLGAQNEVMRLTSTQRVGIGTTNPGERLEVSSSNVMVKLNAATNTFAQLGYYENGSLKWNAYNDYNTDNYVLGNSGGSRLFLTQDGNLGLSVTPSNWNILKAIEIGNVGNFYAGFNGGSAVYMGSGAYYNSGWKYATTGDGVNLLDIGNGVLTYNNASSGTAGNAITWNARMQITSGGNVLIGTTTDAGQKLQVSGTSYLNGSTSINTSAAKGALNVNGTIGLRYGATRTYSVQGDVVITVSDLEPLNGNNWKNALLLIAYTGIEGNQSNDTIIYCMVKLQGLTTWSTATVSNIVGTATVTLSNAASTSCTITLDVNNNINGSAYVVLADINSGNLS